LIYMSVKRDKLIAFCDEYLKVADFEDKCFNGLQVEGKEDVAKIVTGVSLSKKLIEEALKLQADMIMVHHGFFSSEFPAPLHLTGYRRNRLKMILANDLNVAGYHLPLDAHPVIGDNISLCKKFGVKKTRPFSVGFIGELDREIDFERFRTLVEKQLCTQSFAMAGGKKKVKKVAVISGGDSPDLEPAALAGADVFVTGDVREDTVRRIEEVGIGFINAGHYNTEKEGIRNLGELVAKKFKIEAKFVDVPNDI